ncbi:gamma-glutamyltransferase family protein [Marinibactrum halimedae]|uniref:Gamma-glutamyltranspeptidase n=1 Tax=Marinibactrum halimedae TaxID=1444977 RepID=A0AA37T2W9_9GAMM|nr:gamma-glutamyltransferase [Marinibactrum halimedae]MCD9459684.1 gamma-glutamyltransferase [Marinibactrum halimedae]GLS25710.1 gamma-glutamyltranspeptidase [Marinibactrum halimedae]
MATVAFTAPHFKASEVALEILKEGGNAVDAMVAAAATIAVVYPHMNSFGGDGFWVIQKPGEAPVAIDASGKAARQADIQWYRSRGHSAIPNRGPLASLTMAGTVSGWQKARDYAESLDGVAQPLPLSRLLGPAAALAREGITVTQSLQAASVKTFEELSSNEEFAKLYLNQGETLKAGEQLTNPALADLLDGLAERGLDDFYRGDIAKVLASSLEKAGSPITLEDFESYHAEMLEPLTTTTGKGQLFNMVAPTQGVASLIILALYDRIYQDSWNETERVHHLVECIKQAFIIRDTYVTDRSRLKAEWSTLLDDAFLDDLAKKIDSEKALPWPHVAKPGDTIWMGALDKDGMMVSFIQSGYWEFGSGQVIPEYGLVWNNRGLSFSLDITHHNHLAGGMKPFHTLNPAFALLEDGRRFSYGTMGGEGQPQTQAALFTRHIYDELPLTEAIAKDRWLLGRTWGDVSNNLKLEQGLYQSMGAALSELGHDVAEVPGLNEMMGHAGGIILSPDGSVQAATDPRSDGAALTAEV